MAAIPPASAVHVEDFSVTGALVMGAMLHRRFPGWRFVLGLDTASGAVHHYEAICLENGAARHWRLSPDEDSVDNPRYPDEQVHTGDGLTARTLRTVPLGELQARLQETALTTLKAATASLEAAATMDSTVRREAEHLRRTTRDAFHKRRRPGRAGRPDIEYARIADLYVRALATPRPVVTLSRELHLSQSQVRNLLHAARRRGLLTAAPAGRPGGQLTEKARQLLASDSGT